MDGLQVAVVDERPVGDRGGVGEQVLGVGAVELGSEEGPVAQGVEPADDVEVLRRVRVGRADDVQVVGHRGAGAGARRPQRLHGEAVAEVEVVHRGQRVGLVLPAGGVDPGAVPQVGGAPRLVQGGPGVDAVPEDLGDLARVRRERLRGGPGVHPPASSSCCGRSQWYRVAIGATPAASSWSTSRE